MDNLKQVGLSFRQWPQSMDRYPMKVPLVHGGAMEWSEQGTIWPVFQVMSNELNTPKILICTADNQRTNAPSFDRNLNNWELSYFVGLDADETQPQMILTGDSNLELDGKLVASGLVELRTNQTAGWTRVRHNLNGNVGLADGSVQGYNNTRFWQSLSSTGDTTNRIVIP